MKRIINLEPSLNEKQKTFGNKAIVEIEIDNETNKFKYTLYSYGTKICSSELPTHTIGDGLGFRSQHSE